MALHLSGGSRVEVHGLKGSTPRGAFQATGMPASDGAVHARHLGDAFTPAAWFYPPLLLAAINQDGASATDLGEVTLDGVSYEHLRLSREIAHQNAKITAQLAQLSQADLYLDPATLLPARLRFTRHPDGNIRRGVPVEIRYRGWHPSGGIEVPSRIERWYNGTLQLTITPQAAAVNPTLAASEFSLEAAQ